MSGVASLKPWSARAWLRRESERGSEGPEKVKCQPACLEGMFRDATAAIRTGACAQRHGKFRERHV